MIGHPSHADDDQFYKQPTWKCNRRVLALLSESRDAVEVCSYGPETETDVCPKSPSIETREVKNRRHR